MRESAPLQRRHLRVVYLAGSAAILGLLFAGCAMSPYEARHEAQWNSKVQIWQSEASQVKVRAAQSRIFEIADRLAALKAVISVFQDLGFQIDVLDEELGIVSGKTFVQIEKPEGSHDPFYHLYDDESLLIFTRLYRTWGPFWHRNDLVRLTVTLRSRSEAQLVVRASAQYYLRAVEDPEPYQRFFRTLEQALFAEAHLAP